MSEEQRRGHDEQIERALALQKVPDHELIATAPGPKDDRYPMEMTRRLKDAIGELTAELKAFRTSSDRLARLVVYLTTALVIFTAVILG
ncbi:MAG: hypothetical protein M3Z75_31175 [Actinomycetota bacterium]|nr:hypothetical protein [Actinomycetota bacterium]